MEVDQSVVEVFELAPDSELRFEVSGIVEVQLVKGNAEVFGIAMVRDFKYKLVRGKYAAYSWFGAELKVTGATEACYSAENTAMKTYVNVHGQLEILREVAMEAKGKGPRVLVVGGADSGKSSLCRILTAYAARRNHRPMVVDLDVNSENSLAPGGCVGCAAIDADALSLEEGYTGISPLAYFYGHTDVGVLPEHFERLMKALAATIEKRMAVDQATKGSGVVVNTGDWTEGTGKDLLLSAVRTFQINLVLVIGNDKLLNALKKDLGASVSTMVAKLPRSDGVVQRTPAYRQRSAQDNIRAYFQGVPGLHQLSPTRRVLGFDEITVVEIRSAEDAAASESMRPIGRESTLEVKETCKVEITPDLQFSLLAIALADDLDTVLNANIAGLVHVQGVDMEKRQVTFLAPSPGPFPSNFLIKGSIKWAP